MRRPAALPVLFQVGALAAAAVIASQAVAFAVVVLSPDPRPDGFSVSAAADALRGRPAVTQDGRPLHRKLVARPVAADAGEDPMVMVIGSLLARELDVPPDRVQVRLATPRRGTFRWTLRRSDPAPVALHPPPPADLRAPIIIRRENMQSDGSSRTAEAVVTVLPAAPAPESPPRRVLGSVYEFHQSVGIRSDRLTFGPFVASFRLDDGRWAMVDPPRDLLSPWQQRILLALAISALILAPLVWWMARRLTRPIRAFARAAEQLGDDPDAAALDPSGPAEVRVAIQAFNDMQAALRRYVHGRTAMVAAIAHDLRTPLTRLRFRAEKAPAAVRRSMVDDIEQMDAMIAQVLAFVRGEQVRETREALDVCGLVSEVASGLAEVGRDVACKTQGPLVVEVEPLNLRRALSNLIENAVKFGDRARVEVFREGDLAIVSVEDDGPGLSPDQIDRVFEPFHRAEPSRSRTTGGTGLGLALARTVARAHGGEIRLTNRDEGGLCARLSLPLSGAAKRGPTS